MVRPKVVDVGLLRKILNDPVMLCHERGAARAPIATRVGGGALGMCNNIIDCSIDSYLFLYSVFILMNIERNIKTVLVNC